MLIRQPCTGFFDYVALFTLPKDSHSKGFFCFFFFLFFFFVFFSFFRWYMSHLCTLSKSCFITNTIYETRDCYFQPFNSFWTVLLNPNLSLVVSSNILVPQLEPVELYGLSFQTYVPTSHLTS